MKCKKCHVEIDNDSLFCEHCGAKVMPPRHSQWPWIVLVTIALIAGVGVYLLKQDAGWGNSKGESTEVVDQDKVVEMIEQLGKAVENNDFQTISQLYAPIVRRYHDVRDVSNIEVVEKYKNYDKAFGVYGKHVSVRWNTLQVQKLSDGGVSVVYTEDYSIDRVDKTKYSKFVLEKHIELDKDYRIVSIYDVQWGKSK